VNWLLQNFRTRVNFALRNPRYAATSLYRELTRSDERFLSSVSGVPIHTIRSFLGEPFHNEVFAKSLRAAESLFKTANIVSADLFAKKVLLQYAAVRALAPESVIETGVANGVSSAYILLALCQNRKGVLHSIGLNDRSYLPPKTDVGWLVPSWLRDRWRLHLGDTRQILPTLLAQLGAIDVFIHDSLHTYEHMSWEFQTGYAALRNGGLLISDDALWNNAFRDFAGKNRERNICILRGVGFLHKQRADIYAQTRIRGTATQT
jgi:predicted O-methyltransferase YrrM